jgi:hypothetical protein
LLLHFGLLHPPQEPLATTLATLAFLVCVGLATASIAHACRRPFRANSTFYRWDESKAAAAGRAQLPFFNISRKQRERIEQRVSAQVTHVIHEGRTAKDVKKLTRQKEKRY